VVWRVLQAYASHPCCGVGQMSAHTVTAGTNSMRPVAVGISDDKGRMHAIAWGPSVGPPRHQLDWTLEVTSAGEGP
jgi:hypothetical protein